MDFSITADQRLMQESLARTLETAAPLDRVRAFAADREPIARDVWAALADFGLPGWVRLNFGCPRETLDTALQRMASACHATAG